MIPTSAFKRGMKIEMDGTPYEIVEFQHFKPGKGGAMIRTKLRNMLNSKVVDHTYRSGEKVAKADMETRTMQFLYREGTGYAFMDMTTYDQLSLTEEQTSGKGNYLKEGQEAKVQLYKGQAIDIEIPASVIMDVVETEPGAKGDTVSNVTKPAKVESGMIVQVPLFINEGESIKIDTRTGAYLGRE